MLLFPLQVRCKESYGALKPRIVLPHVYFLARPSDIINSTKPGTASVIVLNIDNEGVFQPNIDAGLLDTAQHCTGTDVSGTYEARTWTVRELEEYPPINASAKSTSIKYVNICVWNDDHTGCVWLKSDALNRTNSKATSSQNTMATATVVGLGPSVHHAVPTMQVGLTSLSSTRDPPAPSAETVRVGDDGDVQLFRTNKVVGQISDMKELDEEVVAKVVQVKASSVDYCYANLFDATMTIRTAIVISLYILCQMLDDTFTDLGTLPTSEESWEQDFAPQLEFKIMSNQFIKNKMVQILRNAIGQNNWTYFQDAYENYVFRTNSRDARIIGIYMSNVEVGNVQASGGTHGGTLAQRIFTTLWNGSSKPLDTFIDQVSRLSYKDTFDDVFRGSVSGMSSTMPWSYIGGISYAGFHAEDMHLRFRNFNVPVAFPQGDRLLELYSDVCNIWGRVWLFAPCANPKGLEKWLKDLKSQIPKHILTCIQNDFPGLDILAEEALLRMRSVMLRRTVLGTVVVHQPCGCLLDSNMPHCVGGMSLFSLACNSADSWAKSFQYAVYNVSQLRVEIKTCTTMKPLMKYSFNTIGVLEELLDASLPMYQYSQANALSPYDVTQCRTVYKDVRILRTPPDTFDMIAKMRNMLTLEFATCERPKDIHVQMCIYCTMSVLRTDAFFKTVPGDAAWGDVTTGPMCCSCALRWCQVGNDTKAFGSTTGKPAQKTGKKLKNSVTPTILYVVSI